MWERREEACDVQCIIPTVKVDGTTKKKELVEWKLVRSRGE